MLTLSHINPSQIESFHVFKSVFQCIKGFQSYVCVPRQIHLFAYKHVYMY